LCCRLLFSGATPYDVHRSIQRAAANQGAYGNGSAAGLYYYIESTYFESMIGLSFFMGY
jgi:hypothetical protein